MKKQIFGFLAIALMLLNPFTLPANDGLLPEHPENPNCILDQTTIRIHESGDMVCATYNCPGGGLLYYCQLRGIIIH